MFWVPFFWGGAIFLGVPPLMNKTAKTCFGEGLIKICPAVAEQSSQKKKNTERPPKYKKLPSLAASGAVY